MQTAPRVIKKLEILGARPISEPHARTVKRVLAEAKSAMPEQRRDEYVEFCPWHQNRHLIWDGSIYSSDGKATEGAYCPQHDCAYRVLENLPQVG